MSSEPQSGLFAFKALFWALVVYFTLCGLLFFIDRNFVNHLKFLAEWHAEAVDAGKAEYYLDEHHERQWRWKP